MALRLDMHLGADGPVLDAFMRSRAPFSCIRGPLGSGKTIGTAQRLLKQMTEQPTNAKGERPTRWLVVRNTYGDLTQTTIKDFLAVFEGLGTMRYGGLEPPNFHARFRIEDGTIVDAEVIFLALDRDDSIKKLKGYQLTGAWFNELSEISKAIVDMADLRHGRYPSAIDGVRCGWHGILGDTNSFDEDHWLYRLAEEVRPDGWEFFVQPGGVLDTGDTDALGRKIWRPNPLAENLSNLPDGYYVRGLQGKDDAWIKVMLANEYGFVVHGKPVHPRYVDSVHCAPEIIRPDPNLPLVLGVDFGRTPATAILQRIPSFGRWLAIDELPSEDMSASVYAPVLKRYLDLEYRRFSVSGYGDPAGDDEGQQVETTCIQILCAQGIPLTPAPSNRAALRRAALDKPLMDLCMDGRPRFLLSPKCKKLRKALMGGYHYRKLQVGGPEARYSDAPEKNDSSHIAEALEYALLGGGEMHAALRRPDTMRTERMQETAVSEWNP